MLLTANLEDVRYSLRALSGPPAAPEAVSTARKWTVGQLRLSLYRPLLRLVD